MKGWRLQRLVMAAMATGLGALGPGLGVNLVPTWQIAEARGITAQWALTWIVIWLTTLAAVTLAVFLIAVPRDRGAA